MRVFNKIVFVLLLCKSIHIINAQKDSVSTDSVPPHLAEKVYLQLDGKVYTKGNVIWFKSIVSGAGNHFPSTLSGILYVELVDSDKTIMERKLIKLNNGIGQGFFELFESYPARHLSHPGIHELEQELWLELLLQRVHSGI